MKWCLLFLLVPSLVYAQDWGGTAYRDADSVQDATISSDTPDSNWGASGAINVWSGVSVERQNSLIRFENDPHTTGWTQTAGTLFVWYDAASSDPDASTDSLILYGYVLRRTWNEGNENGLTADSGDCDWTATMTKTSGADSVSWSTPGAQNTNTDRQNVVACSSKIIEDTTASQYLAMPIASGHMTQDFFDYGMVLTVGWSDANNETVVLRSSENSTVGFRWYINGYESVGATSAGYGDATFGGNHAYGAR